MSTIDRDLVRAVNSGMCFAIVGSGPSCEVGMPTWKDLAKMAIEELERVSKVGAPEKTKRHLDAGDYPAVFQKVQEVIGKELLLRWLREAISKGKSLGKKSKLYPIIAEWPFACYLTTNYDDLLLDSLKLARIQAIKRLNSEEDFRIMHDASRDIVFKIHGDPTSGSSLILTSDQYEDFRNSPARAYWREKISAVLHMKSVVILGYSISDPDFTDQLERAKKVASQSHPVFLFAHGIGNQKIVEYFTRYNIRVIPYDNTDGTHRGLIRVLERYSPFIARRGSPNLFIQPVDPSQAQLAASIYIFTKLRLVDENSNALQNAYSALILAVLADNQAASVMHVSELQVALKQRAFAYSVIDPVALDKALHFLHDKGYISIRNGGAGVLIEVRGKEAIATAKAERKQLKQKFQESCMTFLRDKYSGLQNSQIENIINALDFGLVDAFRARGLEIARSVFSDSPIDFADSLDMLDLINVHGSKLEEKSRAPYCDLMLEVVIRPSKEIRDYLALLSQGYFSYHSLGLDPKATGERLEVARNRLWILDSSIIIPAIARGCLNHLYAADLLRHTRELDLKLIATRRLLFEVADHARFALGHFADALADDPILILAATGQAGYRPNLFIEGYIKWSLTNGNPSVRAYFKEILGTDELSSVDRAIEGYLSQQGIQLLEFEKIDGFQEVFFHERDCVICPEIRQTREQAGTFRGDEQCLAEAEIVIICRQLNAYFLSLSTILNRLRSVKKMLCWKPEAMYRFLALFSTSRPQDDLLYACMTQDYFSAGITIVDNESIGQFAAPTIRQSKLMLETERATFEKSIGRAAARSIIDEFDRTSEEQKPFYGMRIAFYVASRETEKRVETEAILRSRARVTALNEKERSEYERLKSKRDERIRRARRKKRAKGKKKDGKSKS